MHQTLCSQKSACNFWVLKNMSLCPWGIGPQHQSEATQVPCVKWCRTMHITGPSLLLLNPQMQNPGIWGPTAFYWKQPIYKWNCTLQTHVVQGPTVHRHLLVFINLIHIYILVREYGIHLFLYFFKEMIRFSCFVENKPTSQIWKARCYHVSPK